jgi:hypothetical protein
VARRGVPMLDNGLHDTHLAAEAWLAEQLAQCRRGQTQAGSGDGTPRHTAVDVTAQYGRRIRGYYCGVGW